MTFVLDTSVLVDMDHGDHSALTALSNVPGLESSIPTITFMSHFEFIYGLEDMSKKSIDRSLEFINEFVVLQTTRATSIILSGLKRRQEKKGNPIALSDLIIAALCIENGMTLITRDKDFERILGLRKVII